MDKNKYKFIIENMPDAFAYHKAIYDEKNKAVDYIFLEANKEFGKMIGLKKEEIIDKKATELFKKINNTNFKWIEFFGKVALSGESKRVEKYFKSLNKLYEVKVYSKEKGFFITIFHNITERKQLEKDLKKKNILLNSILESIQDGISVLKPDLTISYSNSKIKEWNKNKINIEGKKCFEVYYDKNEACDNCPVLRSLKTGKMENEVKKINKKFDIDYVETFSYPIFNNNNEITGIVEFMRDISNRKKREREINYLLYRDTLTGIYNRRFFEEEMKRLDTKRQLPISIIMGDLNGLKIINDSYGHDKGDKMLVETAKLLKEEIREEDILARHGGDEFTILLPQTANKEAQKIVKRIKDKNLKVTEDQIPISIGLGVATKNKFSEDINEILKKADNQMYKNKLSESRSTKNKIVENLINTLAAKSSETREHAIRMTKLAYDLGEKINLSNLEINNLLLLATLHDIGKTTISENILTKEEKLTKEEWEIIKQHPERGYKIASASEEFSIISEEILAHHEHWDGNGYPNSLKGKDIPYLARIISIIDAYDVMTHDRPYSVAISEEEALAEIKRCAGTQFDPNLVKEFIELLS